ncbi:MAG: YkgJ family cysteine cluster protein [Methanotrichaceae archaeon]|nr:YkgJ family cysteine cluster protein [Methanotrichaceae archaeon]
MPKVLIETAFEEIRFSCQRCGSCCHHRRPLDEFDDLIPMERLSEFVARSNLIYLTKSDISNIGKRARKRPEEFAETLRPYDGQVVKLEDSGRIVLLDIPVLKSKKDTTCVFYDVGNCRIHAVRPVACRLFPFRVDETETPEGDILLRIGFNPNCPGIGKGPVVDKGRLEELVSKQFLERSSAIAGEIESLRGKIAPGAKVYRSFPGRRP